jgi:hypothetical protein
VTLGAGISGADAILAAALLDRLADEGYRVQAEIAVGVSDMINQVQALVATYPGLADQLDSDRDDTSYHLSISLPVVRAAALSSLRRGSQDSQGGQGAVAVMVAGE